jgi:tRNA-dihydrouridine synthase
MVERVDLLLENLRMSIAHKKDENRATIEMRKLYSGYLRGFPGVARVRGDLMKMTTYSEIEARLQSFVQSVKLETEAA